MHGMMAILFKFASFSLTEEDIEVKVKFKNPEEGQRFLDIVTLCNESSATLADVEFEAAKIKE